MPLTVNVGLSRKQSENFNSQGCSIHLSAELDQSLLARPDDLQGAIHELYEQAEYALVRQASSTRQGPADRNGTHSTPTRVSGNAHAGNGRLSGMPGRGMTPSQRRAVFSIAEQLGLDPVDEARDAFGIDLDHASLEEASKLIDHLKAILFSNQSGRS